MTKTVIAPIVSAIILILQNFFGLTVPEEVGGQITDAVVSLVTGATVLYGIYKQFKNWRNRSK